MKSKHKEPFIPRDKPKSWVLGIVAGLFGLLVAGPAMILGGIFELTIIMNLGITLFVASWSVAAVSWVIFMVGLTTGMYSDIQEQEWNKQIW